MAFTSWRDVGNEVKAKWPDPSSRDDAFTALVQRFPSITLNKSGKSGAKITCRDAAQVFFVKETIRDLGGRA